MNLKEAEEAINKIMNQQERLIQVVEGFKERLNKLDIRASLLKDSELNLTESEKDKIVVGRVESILLTVKTFNMLNKFQKEAFMDYLSKKSNVGKTQINAFLETADFYLERLTEGLKDE